MHLKIAGYQKHSSVNGPGIRFVLFVQGCPHHCPGCQNPETHDRDGGQEVDTDEILRIIADTRYLDGVTLSGGDPFLQAEAMALVARRVHELGMSVWAYTGWTYEQILDGQAGEEGISLLKNVDVLVDGRYIESRRSADVIWRGSSNQRLIDVASSLKEGRVIPQDTAAEREQIAL